MYDVITVGSATVDVFAHTESELIKIKTIHGQEELIAYPSGSKILIQRLEFKVGGGGTNTAVSFSRLGLKTAYLGNIGLDENGSKVISLLKKEKIEFIGVRGEDQTGYSIILDSIENDRTILTNKGANNNLKFTDINKKKLNSKWFYFSSMMGNSLKSLELLSEYAKNKGIKIAFNPSIYLIKDNKKEVQKILQYTDVLIFNKEEAEALVGNLPLKSLILSCHDFGPKIIVITDGKNGCYSSDKKNVYVTKPRKVKVVETTGAGDAFASSFLSGLIKKNDLKFAIRLGMTNSESVISHIGAKENLLSYNVALKDMNRSLHKVKKL